MSVYSIVLQVMYKYCHLQLNCFTFSSRFDYECNVVRVHCMNTCSIPNRMDSCHFEMKRTVIMIHNSNYRFKLNESVIPRCLFAPPSATCINVTKQRQLKTSFYHLSTQMRNQRWFKKPIWEVVWRRINYLIKYLF